MKPGLRIVGLFCALALVFGCASTSSVPPKELYGAVPLHLDCGTLAQESTATRKAAATSATAAFVLATDEQRPAARQAVIRAAAERERAEICNALAYANQQAASDVEAAGDLMQEDRTSGSALFTSALAVAGFTALNPRNTDNIAVASLVGSGSTAFRSGLKPAERARILLRGSEAMNCIAREGQRYLDLSPSLLEMSGMAAVGSRAWQNVVPEAVILRATEMAKPEAERDRAKLAAIEQLQEAADQLRAANQELSKSIAARREAPSRIKETVGTAKGNISKLYAAEAVDFAAALATLSKKPSEPGTSGVPSTEEGATTMKSLQQLTETRSLGTTADIEQRAAQVRVVAALVSDHAATGDQQAYEAVGACAAKL